ncbi:MAG: VWA domain-containing protein [Oligoflexia bacterium]|nr:VWA domain-containing protein [Oligoflexia bacterium]
MQRWHLTAGLAGATAVAALVIPTLRGPTASNLPSPAPQPPIATPGISQGFDGALQLSATLDRSALLVGSQQDRYLVIDISAPDMPGDLRRPVNLAVVMDTSGSMAGRGKIDNARMAAAELVGQLGPEDTFSLVTFSDVGRVVVPTTAVTDQSRLARLVKSIRPGGGTNLSSGLKQGLAQLSDPSLEGVRRVVLLSDGMANIGVTDVNSLAQEAGSRVSQGVTVSAMGLGLDYNEDLLTAMSDAGGGSYHFVDRPGQLAAMFSKELRQMTRVAGREVAVDVTLPQGVSLQQIYGWGATTTTDGYRVFLGDVHGGETRKIVARVHVDAPSAGTVGVADVRLRYSDADTGRLADEAVAVAAVVTPDAAVADSSTNKTAGIAAAKAHAGALLDQSARSYSSGDVAGNQRQLAQAEEDLKWMGVLYDAPELKAQVADIAEQRRAFRAAAPTSDAGLRQVKKSKESARAYAR